MKAEPLDTPWRTRKGAARYAGDGTGPRQIDRAVAKGELKAARVGGRREYRIHTDWIDSWLASKVSS